jgi:hypothetical protein
MMRLVVYAQPKWECVNMTENEGSMREVAATLVRGARVLVEAALSAAELIPNATLSQKPLVDTVRGYAREADSSGCRRSWVQR